MNNPSLSALTRWVECECQRLNLGIRPLQPIVGDAGFRQYYRMPGEPALLAVHAPPETEKNREFVRISEYWRAHDICAPEVLAVDYASGFLLVEDFGAQSFSDILAQTDSVIQGRHTTIEEIYQPAVTALHQLQKAPSPLWLNPYNAAEQQREMDLFLPWFVEAMLGYSLNPDEDTLLKQTFATILAMTTTQPNVMVHRDFHCRNIQIKPDGSAGLIDFQDALFGPVTYDLVSLYKDCYQQWPLAWVKSRVADYRNQLPEALQMESFDAFWQAFEMMGVQRHLKVLGIFARLSIRDNKPRYLSDLPLVVAYVRDACARYDALMPFATWFDESLMPRIESQAWYRSVVIQ